MKQDKDKIDDLLKTTLSDFRQEPTPKLWEKLSGELSGSGITKSPLRHIRWIIPVTGILLLTPIAWNVFTGSPKNQITRTEQQHEIPANIQSMVSEPEKSAEGNSALETSETEREPIETHTTQTFGREGKINTPSVVSNTPEKRAENGISGEESSDPILFPSEIDNPYLTQGYFHTLIEGTLSGNLKVSNISGRNSAIQSIPLKQPDWLIMSSANLIKDDYGRKANWYYGINFIPEIIFSGNRQARYGMAVELTGVRAFDVFSIETGFGLNRVEDEGQYKIDYLQYDSIAYFYKVTSFTVDETTGKPQFNTTVETVFDSIAYTSSESVRNSYTYLYFPLHFGAQVKQFRRFSLHTNAGIIYSVLIDRKEPQSAFRNDRALNLTIINESPARIESQVLITGSVGINFAITGNIYIHIEPGIKYPVKPVYEKRYDPGKTWSTYLRTGLYFKF